MHTNTTRVVLVAVLAALSACGSPERSGGPPAGDPGTTVTTALLSFQPQKLTVKAGSTVRWTVSDSIAHTVTTGTFTLSGDGLRTEERPDGVLDKPLSSHHAVSFTFSKPGKYTYFCSIHKGMTGEIDVTP